MAFNFFKVSEANAKCEALTAELATSRTALETAKTEHATAFQAEQAKVQERDQQIVALTGERDTAQETIKARDAEIARLKGEATTTHEKAAEIAATVGISAPVAGTNDGTKTKEQLWQEYHALPLGEGRNEFFKKNRAAMVD